MIEEKIEVGTIVRHPNRPEWGPGKALVIGGGGQVTVYFRDIEEKKTGDAVKTLATKVVALEIASEQNDSMLDSLPLFKKGRFEGVKKPRLSLDHAVRAYLNLHPEAFDDPANVERTESSTLVAHRMWLETLGNGKGDELLDEGKIGEARQRLSEIGAASKLVTDDERRALEEALDDEKAAETFLRALFDVVSQDTPDQTSYQRLIDAVCELPEQEGATRVSTWSVLTQYPFIACPEHHSQLRPVTVRKCASRLNFDLRYTTELNWWTYGRFLRIAAIILDRLKPLGAKDLVDVQSFMRVIAAV